MTDEELSIWNTEGDPDLEQHLGREGSLCWHLHRCHHPEAAWVSVYSQPPVTHALQCSESPHGPLLLQHCSPMGRDPRACGSGEH